MTYSLQNGTCKSSDENLVIYVLFQFTQIHSQSSHVNSTASKNNTIDDDFFFIRCFILTNTHIKIYVYEKYDRKMNQRQWQQQRGK